MRHPKGFTLLEFIIYFALISIVISAITLFALDVIRTRAKTAVIAEVEQNMRFGMQRMLRTVRQASKLNVGASTFNSDSGVLSVDMPSASNTPTVFDLSGGAVRMKEGSGPATPLTTPRVNVTSLRFSKDNLGGNNNAVTAVITLAFASDNPDQAFTYVAAASGTAVIRKD
ncbi:MAG: prepilin-type N-terminal cleavage/methylation domain-containing protein [Patescibacteria group bacterium]